MIEVNDRYSLKRDKDQWILIEKREGISKKTKEPIIAESQIYHGTLVQALCQIYERSGEHCEISKGLMLAIEAAQDVMRQVVKEYEDKQNEQ